MDYALQPVQTKQDIRDFIRFPKSLYANDEKFVPLFDIDMRAILNRRHPYFSHTNGDFFLIRNGNEVVARALVAENDLYNREHDEKCAHFYFVDFVDDAAVTDSLFSGMADWARSRGLSSLRGPLFSAATMGGGVLIKGHEHLPAMTMMGYNYPYYEAHYERAGFAKLFDLYSLRADPATFRLPDRVERMADHVRERGRLQVVQLRNNRQMKKVANEVRKLHNDTLGDHREGYPLSEIELDAVVKELLQIAHPLLEKVITYDGEVVGYMFGFPDITRAIQRNGGRIGPVRILRLLRAKQRPTRVLLNGMGILEKYQRIGGNALIYSEIVKTIQGSGVFHFDEAEMVQINEETTLMLSDMLSIGGEIYKIHRVYARDL
jgi:hypothetical protein